MFAIPCPILPKICGWMLNKNYESHVPDLKLQWNPFLATSRIATTVAITTDLQIPVFPFLWVM